MNFNEAIQMLGNKLQGKYGHLGFKYKKSDKTLTRHSKNFTYMIAFSSFGGNTKDSISITIFYKGIMPSEKILDLPVDCNTLTGCVNL